MKRAVGLCALLLGSAGVACGRSADGVSRLQPHLGMTEEQIFDATRQSPAALLRQLYEEHQVLVLSHFEHFNERPYRALNLLLDQVGHDPRLRYVVLETGGGIGGQIAPLLEAVSVTDIDETQLKQQRLQFDSAARKWVERLPPEERRWWEGPPTPFLCSGDGAFVWSQILPRLRALNATRPAGREVLATDVDGVFTMRVLFNQWFASYERDSLTAVQFDAKIWRALRRDRTAKAIVVYHIAHTMQGFTAPRGGRTIAPNFLSTFLRDHPDARPRTAVVMIEGRGDSGKANQYEFKFTERQLRRADQPFGVRTAPFRAVAAERGDSALTADAWNPGYALGGSSNRAVQSAATLPEMVDAIVWLPRSEQPAYRGYPKMYMPACR